MESLIQMVSKGMGITVLPKPYIDFLQNKNIQAIKIENPTPTIEIGLIYRKDKYMCVATREFIEQLKVQYVLSKTKQKRLSYETVSQRSSRIISFQNKVNIILNSYRF